MNAAGASAQPSAAKKRKPSKKAQAAAERKAAEDLSAQLQLEADEEAARAKDYFALLPNELLSHIFSYMDPISLFKLQGISTFFQEHLKRSDRLFEMKCKHILAFQQQLPTYMTHQDLLRLALTPICQFCASARGNSRPYVPYNYVACRPCFEDRTISFQQAIATAEALTGLGPDCVSRLVENCIYASDQPFHRNMPPRNSRFRLQDVENFCGAFIDSGRPFAAFLEDEKRNLAVGLKARRDIESILTNRGNISTLARQHSLYARKFCVCQRIYMIFNETNIEEELAKYVPNVFETFFSRAPPYISTKEDVRLYSDKLKTRLESERRIAKKQRQCNAAINFINELNPAAVEVYKSFLDAQPAASDDRVLNKVYFKQEVTSICVAAYLRYFINEYAASSHVEHVKMGEVIHKCTFQKRDIVPDSWTHNMQIRCRSDNCNDRFVALRSISDLTDHIHYDHLESTNLDLVALVDPNTAVVRVLPDTGAPKTTASASRELGGTASSSSAAIAA